MRGKSLCGGLALLLAAISGCKQPGFVTLADLNGVQSACLPNLECKPGASCKPLSDVTGPPPTLDNLDRKVRFISLAECIAIALETGSPGSQNIIGLNGNNGSPGSLSPYFDTSPSFAGPLGRSVNTNNDSIRVLSYDPARLNSDLENSLTRFDAAFVGSMTWNTTDTPIATSLQSFQAGQSGLNAIQTEAATASAGLYKPLPTGGVAGVTFNVPYTYTNLPARTNPAYQPQLLFQFEQPLLQGFGVEINQLRAQHPGSIITPGVLNGAPTQEGILITRVRFDEQRIEFERLVHVMLGNVEVGYWNLYGAYWGLYAQEAALRINYEVYRQNRASYEAGRLKAADFFKTRGQYEQFRAQRLAALNTLLDAERQLRALMGLPVDDGTRLVPSDEPTLAPYKPDWDTAARECLANRPELLLLRQEVKVAQFNLLLAKNSLLPDLRFTSTYDVNSLGTRLDGPDNNTAFRNLASGGFNNWQLGLRAVVPLGFRSAFAVVRQRQLELARTMEVLHDQETKALRFLAQQYRLLSTKYELIRANQAQRESYGAELKSRYQEYVAGRGTLDILLESQRFWATALSSEYNEIANYNINLAGFEFAKGTILQHDNVVIAEGALPQCAQGRAVEHQRKRTAALVLRERAKVGDGCGANGCANGAPQNGLSVPRVDTTSLPGYLQTTPAMTNVPALPATIVPGDTLPAPVEAGIEDLMPPTTGPASRPPAIPPPSPGPRAPSDFGSTRADQPLRLPAAQPSSVEGAPLPLLPTPTPLPPPPRR